MKSLFLGSLLAAVALFFWGFIYYGVSGFPFTFLATAENPGPAVLAAFPEDGTYILPDPRSPDANEQYAQGPIAMVHLHRAGAASMGGPLMIAGFVHGFLYCLMLGVLLQQICKKTGYLGRVGFVTLAGTAGAFMARAGDVIWWYNPWAFQISHLIYAVLASAIVGLVLAKFIKSPVTP